MINFISQAEIEELCEAMLRQHLGQEEPIPQSVDIDGFLTCLRAEYASPSAVDEADYRNGIPQYRTTAGGTL